jgi:pSer/pThr/pTyr-binding forkhead associated (FHA) protein
LGGGLGGWAFQLTADLLGKSVITVRGGNESGSISRAIGLTVTGAGIGLLIGLVEALSRQAWVRLILGRNEGKEWPIDTDSTALGRDERAQIPLFGDPNVASLHALIVKQKGFYYLVDQGSPIGIALNGQRVQNAQLAPGDHIQIGSHQLEFQLRDGQVARASREARMHAVPIQGVPMQPMQQPMPQQPTMAQTQAYMPSVAPSQPTVAFAPQAMSLSLVATNGPIAGQRFPVVGNLIIGRESAGITLGFDTMASRNHAEISPSGEIRDLGSTNGTLVNGAKIQSTNLKVGDVVQVGATTFRVE